MLKHAALELDHALISSASALSSSSSLATVSACHVGLEVTLDLPHTVLAVRDLMDMRGLLQGHPRYSNYNVHVGDSIVAINGAYIEHQVKKMPWTYTLCK